MKLFLRNYLLLSLLTLFSCVEKSTTDSNNPPTTSPAPSLAIDYDISGNFYIALGNTNVLLKQKTDFGSQSRFSTGSTLPNGLSLDVTNGNISGIPTTVTLPTPYTVTTTKDSKSYTKVISLGIAPSLVWVTPLSSNYLRAYVVGDGSKQIDNWTWGSSDENLLTVVNGLVSPNPTATGGNSAIIYAKKDASAGSAQSSYSNGISITVGDVGVGKIITMGTSIHLMINSGTTAVTNNQFRDRDLTSVVIPNGVTSISDAAFYNNSLTSMVIPNSVNNIGNNAFSINQLTRVVIPNSVTNIGSRAFYNNQLTSVIIPDSVTNIGSRAFYLNGNLGEVSLKQSLYTKITNTSGTNNMFSDQVTNYIIRP